MSRKSKAARNIGGDRLQPATTQSSRGAVMLPERLMKALLEDTVERLRTDQAELERFFSHFFDATVTEEDVADFVAHFIRKPPKTVLGYARSSADFPCFAVVMENENEDEMLLGDFAQEDVFTELGAGEEPSEYDGGFWNANFGVYIYAEHPDAAGYLYQFAKAVLLSGRPFFMDRGVISMSFSGGDLAPDENYMPDNMFVRVLHVTMLVPATVPRLLLTRPHRIRISGIFGRDVVVDGMAGAVTPYEATTDVDE